jgi:hypothetical protein
MRRTGVKATEEEAKRLADVFRESLIDRAFASLGCKDREPRLSVEQECHSLALEHGLPEIPGLYWIDLTTREFLAEK